MTIRDRIKHAWNAFRDQDPDHNTFAADRGVSYGVRPDRRRAFAAQERSIIASIYNRIAVDVASTDIRHVRLDDQKRYESDIESGLNNCLSVEANLDQDSRAFIQDVAQSLLETGDIAVVPVDTTINPEQTGGYDVQSLRVGVVTKWRPASVRVNLYNDETGRHEEVPINKKAVALIENPFYSVMNEKNSTLQRIQRKLALLDVIDEQSGSGKLDLIIQLPYVVKSDAKRDQAEKRRKDIEWQLKGSQYGIAYTDGTEKITQLNRPSENNLLGQVTYLMTMLMGQLGITEGVLNGTADEATMQNYKNRTVAPILDAITGEFKRKFLTKTARTQGQSIEYFQNPFKNVTMSDFAEMADKFARNEIFSPNEIRGFIGIKPDKTNPTSDTPMNSNMPQPNPWEGTMDPGAASGNNPPSAPTDSTDTAPPSDDAFAEINKTLDDVFNSLGA